MAVEAITSARIHEHAREWEHTALTTELLLGIGTVVLAILGIVGVFPSFLAAKLTSGEPVWLNSFLAKNDAIMRQLVHCMSLAAAGAEILAGLAALVLGILALVGIASVMMVLIALLAIGISVLLRSSALEGFLLDIL